MSLANSPPTEGPRRPLPRIACTAPTRAALLCLVLICIATSARAQEQAISSSQLDAWIFQQYGDAAQGRRRLDVELELRVVRMDRTYTLREDQKERLRLAGEGDIQRFFNRVYAAHQKLKTLEIGRQNVNDAFQLTVPLQQELASGLLGPDSLFAKSVTTILDAEQAHQFEEQQAARQQQREQAFVRLAVAHLEQSIPLTASQREQLTQLAESRSVGANLVGQLAFLKVRYDLFMLPDERLREVLDDQQMAAFGKCRVQMRGIEQALRQQGLLDDEAGL